LFNYFEGRRGLLLSENLPLVVPAVIKALVYDEPKGYTSVGSHIRDAACYVCWSFARAFSTDDIQPYVEEIAGALLAVACYDREVNKNVYNTFMTYYCVMFVNNYL